MADPPTVLIGWELGAGEGHLVRLIPIIRALRENGWSVVAAVRDMVRARRILASIAGRDGPGQFMLGQAPIFLHKVKNGRPTFSLAESLAEAGFADPALIKPVLHAWQALLMRFRPQVVISDFSPSLNLAAVGRVPNIVIGNGWSVPPSLARLPSMAAGYYRNGGTALAEDAICKAIFAVSGHDVRCFANTLRGDLNLVFTHPALDPYADYRDEPVYFPPELSIAEKIKQRRGPALAYLPKAHPSASAVLTALSAQRPPACVYFGGVGALEGAGVVISKSPLDFETLLPHAPFIIHHGGLGTANFALALGVPQLILPTDLEKALIGRGVVNANAGAIGRLDDNAQAISKIISSLPTTIADFSQSQSYGNSDVGISLLLEHASKYARG